MNFGRVLDVLFGLRNGAVLLLTFLGKYKLAAWIFTGHWLATGLLSGLVALEFVKKTKHDSPEEMAEKFKGFMLTVMKGKGK